MSEAHAQDDGRLQLRVVEGPQAGEELDLGGPAVIGRSSAGAALVLDDPEVSRRHASLIPEGKAVNVEDLGSTNGTFVNGERLEGSRELVAGDRLRIGTSVIEVRLAGEGEPPEAEAVEEEAPADEPEEAEEADTGDTEAAGAQVVEEAAEPEPAEAEPAEAEEPAPPEAEEPAPAEAEEAEAAEAEPAEAEAEPAKKEEEAAPAEAEEAPAAAEQAAAAEGEEAAVAAIAAAVLAKELHARVSECFASVLRAWSNRDADAMRPYVSGRHVERTRHTLDELDRDFQVNYVEDLDLRDVALQRPSAQDPASEPVYAYLAFLARDWIEDLRTGDVVEGDAGEQQAFLERWTFVSEGRRGWVIDRVESVWTGTTERAASQAWPGLPEGWYSRRNRPSTWRRWDGSAWVARG